MHLVVGTVHGSLLGSVMTTYRNRCVPLARRKVVVPKRHRRHWNKMPPVVDTPSGSLRRDAPQMVRNRCAWWELLCQGVHLKRQRNSKSTPPVVDTPSGRLRERVRRLWTVPALHCLAFEKSSHPRRSVHVHPNTRRQNLRGQTRVVNTRSGHLCRPQNV